jgi:hypothetical protein|tara:strand:- start:231 stop:848 length:618 start_codon:yes stop_codon:yes gene_type:complete
MELFKYKNYEDYKKYQIEANIRKINNSYVDPNSLYSLLNYLIEDLSIKPKLILCHGTRRGLEQQYIIDFLKPLGHTPEVIGTEISHTALDYPNTIQWDFHNTKPEWVNNTDVIYSNSFDHSCKPQECLDTWMSCLSKEGVCVLEYSPDCDNKSQASDPFAATLDEYKDFIKTKYEIIDILVNEGIQDEGLTHKGIRYFIIIKNKK